MNKMHTYIIMYKYLSLFNRFAFLHRQLRNNLTVRGYTAKSKIIGTDEITISVMMNKWTESKIDVDRKEVELATVLACGQSFRWKNPDSSSDWIGVFGHHLWVLSQNDFQIKYKVYGPLKKTPKEYSTMLRDYLQLEVSLPELYKQWSKKDSKFAALTEVDYRGIRMLRQDPIENLFSFICSSNNNISRISQMVEKMCSNYGEKITELNGVTYYDFPDVKALCKDGVEKKFREESFGYRAAYIANSAKKILENGGDDWVQSLKNIGYDEARKELQTLPGVGRKVADCICLMSLDYTQAIPVDTHIHQVAKEYLPHIAKAKTLTDKIYSEITDYFRSIYGDYAGWAHSVLFASTLKHLKGASTSNSKQKTKISATKNMETDVEESLTKPVSENTKRKGELPLENEKSDNKKQKKSRKVKK